MVTDPLFVRKLMAEYQERKYMALPLSEETTYFTAMTLKKITLGLFVWVWLAGAAFPASAQLLAKKKKPAAGPGMTHMDDDSRTSARTASRKTSDPFGFVRGGDQHKKNKDCGCPGTKKGERQRRKEFRSHRKRK